MMKSFHIGSTLDRLIAQKPLLVFVVLPSLILLVHAFWYWPFFSDDAFISLRYAERLIDGQGLTWTDGERVEGYSNLSWVLICAVFGWLGFDLVVTARVLGFLCFVGVIYTNYRLWILGSVQDKKLLFYAQSIFASTAAIAIWSIGGLEQPLAALSLTVAVFGVKRFIDGAPTYYILMASLFMGLLCLTRPDGPLFCVGIALGIWWSQSFSIKAAFKTVLLLAIFPVLFVVGQLVFRWHYYGELLPNTAYIKITPSFFHQLLGLRYLLTAFVFMLPLSFLFFRLLKRSSEFRQSNLTQLILPSIILWVAYLGFVGGDIFPGLRHFVVIFSISLLLLPLMLDSFFAQAFFQSRKNVTLMAALFLALQFFGPTSLGAKNEKWEWEGEVMANVLTEAFGHVQPLIAVTSAGAIPYFTGFPVIDMLGLNDHYIARNPVGDPGKAYIGHGFANGQYVYDRNPDIISVCVLGGDACDQPLLPLSNADKQLFAIDGFFEKYKLVRIQGYDPFKAEGLFWINTQSLDLGAVETEEALSVPGYLFSGNVDENGKPLHVSRLNPEGHLSLELTAKNKAWFELGLYDEAKIKNVSVIADSDIQITVEKSEIGKLLIMLQLPANSDVEVALIERVFLNKK